MLFSLSLLLHLVHQSKLKFIFSLESWFLPGAIRSDVGKGVRKEREI